VWPPLRIKKKYEKMFILGPNWVVYSTPHDATSFVIFFNFEFKMLYECECIPNF